MYTYGNTRRGRNGTVVSRRRIVEFPENVARKAFPKPVGLPKFFIRRAIASLYAYPLRSPPDHDRDRTSLHLAVELAFPPALTRLYQILFAPGIEIFTALHASFVTVEVILLALIFTDVRMGERRLAYPLSLGFFVTLHALMFPLSSAPWWTAFLGWYAGSPMAS